MSTNIIFLIGGAVFAIIGLNQLFQAFRAWRRVAASQSWQETNGNIISAKTVSISGGKGGRHHYAKFEYSYEVSGTVYFGKFKKDTFLGTEGAAEQAVADQPIASTVPVRYNPEKPQKCASSFDSPQVMDVIMGLIFLTVGVICIGQYFFQWLPTLPIHRGGMK